MNEWKVPFAAGGDGMIPEHDIIESSRDVLSEKARSFRWAAQFLTPEVHDDAALLYAFCRLVDDTADLATDLEEASHGLEAIERELCQDTEPRPLIEAFLEMSGRRNLDIDCALELIKGVRSDLDEVIIPDDVHLLRYCYRVAGTVGLMMCAVLGVHDPKAHPFALDLGVAMQLTNISRDVAEDARMGRVYLPATRLRREGVSPEELIEGHVSREAVARVVLDLLEMADWYYQSADLGMRFIPRRERLAILVASRVYRGIGVKLREHDGDALAGRTIVHWTGKSRWVAHALRKFATPKIMGFSHLPPHDRELHLALSGLPGANAARS